NRCAGNSESTCADSRRANGSAVNVGGNAGTRSTSKCLLLAYATRAAEVELIAEADLRAGREVDRLCAVHRARSVLGGCPVLVVEEAADRHLVGRENRELVERWQVPVGAAVRSQARAALGGFVGL